MWVALRAALAVVLLASVATAEPSLTDFERQTLVESAKRLGLAPVVDPHPEGKRIERVDIVVLDVFDEHDPVPDFVNVFHTTTRKVVIRNELLFHAGERYVGARVDESARNLRQLEAQLSLVMIVPLVGSAPGRVRVVVVARDVWSLRLNNDFTVTSYGLQTLSLEPSEQNLAGLHTVVAGEFWIRPDAYSFGARAGQQRILGTGLFTDLTGAVIYRRRDGAPEGSRGQLIFGSPLRHSSQRWAFGVGIYWDDEMLRHLQDSGGTQQFDAPSTPGDDRLPIEYRTQRYIGGYEAVRSYGRVEKYDLSFGLEVDRRYNRHTPIPGESAAAERDFLKTWVPVSDTRVSPFVQLRTHAEHYLHTSELETLALEEDYRLGPEVLLKAYPASSKLGSSRNLLGLLSGASMRWALGDGLASVLAENRVEYELDGRHDADVLADVRLVTPRWTIGRLVLDARIRSRYENYLNRYFELGGDTRLRGYPQAGYRGSLKGPLVVALNAEVRTRSIDLFSAHCGLAAFYDAGDATTSFRALFLRQSAGVGLRLLFPQLDRVVLRADWAFPFDPVPGYRTLPGTLFVAYGQAFDAPSLSTPTVMKPDLH